MRSIVPDKAFSYFDVAAGFVHEFPLRYETGRRRFGIYLPYLSQSVYGWASTEILIF